MKTRLLIPFILALTLAGCKTATEKATDIKSAIEVQTSVIETSAATAQAKIKQADAKVVTATTQPGNPPITTRLLTGAHEDLIDASEALDPIAPAAEKINVESEKAAELTAKVEAKLIEERSHWLGYKTRSLLWILAIVGGVLGVGAFLLRTFGLGVLGGFAGDIIGGIWTVAKWVIIPVWHVLTFGLDWFGKKINAKYDSKEKM